jgi:hypothetical protein
MNDVEELLAIRKWLEIAKELRASCHNPDVFDARFEEQRARYRVLWDALFPEPKPKAMRNDSSE